MVAKILSLSDRGGRVATTGWVSEAWGEGKGFDRLE